MARCDFHYIIRQFTNLLSHSFTLSKVKITKLDLLWQFTISLLVLCCNFILDRKRHHELISAMDELCQITPNYQHAKGRMTKVVYLMHTKFTREKKDLIWTTT